MKNASWTSSIPLMIQYMTKNPSKTSSIPIMILYLFKKIENNQEQPYKETVHDKKRFKKQ